VQSAQGLGIWSDSDAFGFTVTKGT
jgi:hypothetical protein